MQESDSGNSITWAPIVEFTPEGSANVVRFKHSISSSHPSWEIGDRVRILSDPTQPQRAMIDSGFWNRATPFVPAAFGLPLALLGVIVLRNRTPR